MASNAMLRLLRKEYWEELRDFAVQSPPKFKIFCVLFIFTANIAGTTPFPQEIFEGFYFLKIWTWSLLANVVFAFTMSLCFFIPLEIAVKTKSKIRYFLSPLVASLLVPIGFFASWFFVCIGTEFDSGSYGYPLWAVDHSIIDFIQPVSDAANLDNLGYFFWAYNGLWAPMLGLSLMVFSSVPVPKQDDSLTGARGWPLSEVEQTQKKRFIAYVVFLFIFVYFEWYRLFK
tara:strand:+ start:181 stop:870 length:690 start_codon:yes stop_codon:yes gene_type:complete